MPVIAITCISISFNEGWHGGVLVKGHTRSDYSKIKNELENGSYGQVNILFGTVKAQIIEGCRIEMQNLSIYFRQEGDEERFFRFINSLPVRDDFVITSNPDKIQGYVHNTSCRIDELDDGRFLYSYASDLLSPEEKVWLKIYA